MKKNYFIVQRGRQSGPISLSELLKIKYEPNTLVWTQGFKEWLNVTNKEDLFQKLGITLEDLQSNSPSQTSSQPKVFTGSTVITGTPNSAGPFISNDISNTHGYILAGRGKRFLAFIFNWIMTAFAAKLIPNSYGEYDGLAFIFIPLTAVVSYNLWSGNIGHKILGLKVIHAVSGEDIKNPLIGFLRELSKNMLMWFTLPIIWLLWDKRKQNVYDKIFRTLVVEQHKAIQDAHF
ncbi:MAG: helix-turn-helix domain protein [Bacteroidota bacterium]|nr:helix-turn-helix domain protein [Bacteroidota bacterium]